MMSYMSSINCESSDTELFDILMETKYELSGSLSELTDLGDGDPLVNLLRDEIDIEYNNLIAIINELRNRGHSVEYPKVELKNSVVDKSPTKCRTGSITKLLWKERASM